MTTGGRVDGHDATGVERGSLDGNRREETKESTEENRPQELDSTGEGTSLIQALFSFDIFNIISRLFDMMPGAKAQGQVLPEKERLQQQVRAAQNVVEAQKQATSLKERAKKVVDPKERRRLLQESYNKEVEAHGQSKYAKRLSSGAWQGAAGGAGIGTSVGMGLGTVVGALVGGLVSIPTLTLGGLIGAGVGGIHGPFIKLGMAKEQKPQSEEEARAQAVREAEALDQAVEQGASSVPEPPKFDDDEDQSQNGEERPHGVVRQHSGTPGAEGIIQTPKKKPRKLEVRSGNEGKSQPEKTKKKTPRKLERRSGGTAAEAD